MTARLDDERVELRDVVTDDEINAVRHEYKYGTRCDVEVIAICDELSRLRSLFTPETVAALEAGAYALDMRVSEDPWYRDESHAKEAAALRALASAVAGAVER